MRRCHSYGLRAYRPLDDLFLGGFTSKVRTSVIEYVLSCSQSLQRAMNVLGVLLSLDSRFFCKLAIRAETGIGFLHRAQETAQ
jgi:hypothetical protein